MPIIRTISGSLTHITTGSLRATSITGSLNGSLTGTASYSSKTNFLENNGYIGDTTYGTQVFHATGSFTGSATSSLVTLKAVRNDLTGINIFCYNLRTDIVGTYADTSGSDYVIGGTLDATVAYNSTNGGVYFVGSITQIKNHNFEVNPEFTYKIDISGNITSLNLKATGKSGDNTYPIKWSSVSYLTSGPGSIAVGF